MGEIPNRSDVKDKAQAYRAECARCHQSVRAEINSLDTQIQAPVSKHPEPALEKSDEVRLHACLEAHDYFGYDQNDLDLVAQLIQILRDKEATFQKLKPGFQITDKSPVFLQKLIEKKIPRKAKAQDETEETKTQAQKEKAKTDKEESQKAYLEKPENQRKPASVQMREMLDQGLVPDEIVPGYQAFLKIIDLAQTPEDQAYITHRINAFDLNAGVPDPVVFIQQEIFSAPDDLDPPVSLATQKAIASEFGIPRIDNGGDLREAGQLVDPTTGEPVYDRDNPLPVRRGVDYYVDPNGNEYLVAETRQGRRIDRIPVDGLDENDLTLATEYYQFWAEAEGDGLSAFLGLLYPETQGFNKTPSPEDLREFRQVTNALYGHDEGYDGEIMQNTRMDYLRWFSQYLLRVGDAGADNYDLAAAKEGLETLAVKDPKTGAVDLEILRAVGLFAQEQHLTGSPDFDLLQWHLHTLYPERVEGPEETN